MNTETVQSFLDFVRRSPSAFHATDALCRALEGAGFVRLDEREPYDVVPGGRYFVTRNLSSVIQDEDELNIDKMTKGEMKSLLHKIYEEKIPVTVINEAKPQKDADHPTMKPVRLFGYQTRNSSKPGDIVLDTFGGSGTTIVACEQLHRKARIMELDPHYCDVIIARWEKLTGKKATKINNN